MAATLQLNPVTWDLMLDANNNIALLAEPSAAVLQSGQTLPITPEAQGAACAIKLFLGEYWWDTTKGVPYLTKILGQSPPLALLKQYLVTAALTVDNVASAQVFISNFDATRGVSGQVQVISKTGVVGAANFSVQHPQGAG